MSNFDVQVHNAITLLHSTIKEQIEATNRQSKTMSALTWAAVLLAVVQVIGMIVQVWLVLH
jgi:Mg2+ and Co2+ transporter CorA